MVARSLVQSVARSVASSAAGSAVGGSSLVLHVAFGESNSGGYALNSDAVAWEVASRSDLQMWNVTGEAFENLDIGTNNNMDHNGLNSTTHGWELGLANRIRQGYLSDYPHYYLQTGQGASIIAEWAVGHGSGYWTKFLSRTAGAKAAVDYSDCFVWLSLGINDAIAGSPISNATYKSGIEDLITRIKAELPGCKFLLFTLPTVNGTYDGYSTQLRDIATADAAATVIEWEAPREVEMRDANHAGYLGMKRLAARAVKEIETQLSTTSKALTWSDSAFGGDDAGYVYFDGPNIHSHASETVNVTVDGSIVFDFATGAGDGLIIALDAATNEVNWGGSDPYYGAAYQVAADIYYSDSNGTSTDAAVNAPLWVRLRWAAANDDLVMESSDDGGSTWTERHTFSAALAGQTIAYVKSLTAINAAFADVWQV